MLWNTSAIHGYAIAASDGQIGTVSDFFFDDTSWQVRWLVVDTGDWLSGRKVLLPPSVLGKPDSMRQVFSVKLSMREVKDSPDVDTDRPVSRQMEGSVYNHYGWSPYWNGGGLTAPLGGYLAVSAPPFSAAERLESEIAEIERRGDDPHLRSAEAVAGYHIHAKDGEIGHVEGFLMEVADWRIHHLIINTSKWWLGKKVMISPRLVQGIDWMGRLINLGVARQRIKDATLYDPSLVVGRGTPT